MDPAHPDSPTSRLERVEAALLLIQAQVASVSAEARNATATLDQGLASLAVQIQTLATALTQLAVPAPPSAPAPMAVPLPATSPPAPAAEPRVGTPERYAGEPEGCNPFLTNCSIIFALQPYTFASEKTRVAFTVNHLTGRARLWGTAEWERQTPACTSFQAFSTELKRVFGMGAFEGDAAQGLMSLIQGNRSVADFSIDFRTRARRSDWNSSALCDAFLHGLADAIKDKLVSYELPSTLDDLIQLAIKVDLRMGARRQEVRQGTTGYCPPFRHQGSALSPCVPLSPGSQPGEPEPMQLGSTRLTPEERARRRKDNLCLYCGQAGHFIPRCPSKDRARR